MRHLALLPVAAALAVLAGCSTEDAGDTLTVEVRPQAMMVAATTFGTAVGDEDTWEGELIVNARVSYQGKKELGYVWNVSPVIPLTVEQSDEELTLSTEITTTVGTGGVHYEPFTNGTKGSLSLTVYEKDGSLTDTATTTITFYYFGADG